MKKIAILASLALISTLSLFASGSKEDSNKIVFAADALWPPMEFINSDMKMDGFDVELVKAMAEAGNFEYEMKNVAWDGIFAGLANGNYAAVASAVTITDERKASMDFTIPYVNVGQIVVVQKEVSDETTIADMKGKELGAQIGTTGAFVIQEKSEASLRSYDDVGLAVEDLYNGKIDGVVCDSATAANFILENEKYNKALKVVGEPLSDEFYGIAIKKGNPELLKLLNDSLQKVIDSGKRDELVEKWLR